MLVLVVATVAETVRNAAPGTVEATVTIAMFAAGEEMVRTPAEAHVIKPLLAAVPATAEAHVLEPLLAAVPGTAEAHVLAPLVAAISVNVLADVTTTALDLESKAEAVNFPKAIAVMVPRSWLETVLEIGLASVRTSE